MGVLGRLLGPLSSDDLAKTKKWIKVFSQRIWGEIELPNGIRPWLDQPIQLRRGFEIRNFTDNEGTPTTCWRMNETAPQLLELFMGLLSEIGDRLVNVCLTVTDEEGNERNFLAYDHQLIVLQSNLWDFEHFLLHDGCVFLSIFCHDPYVEIQLTDEKAIMLYADNPSVYNFTPALVARGLGKIPDLYLVDDGDHAHASIEDFDEQFEKLCAMLGVEEE